MTYNPEKHHRRSIRLQGYDYSKPGWYFVTICTHNQEMLFGDIQNQKMLLNDIGDMVKTIWIEIPQYYPGIQIDYYQIMPNHFHGIINIVGTDPRICADIKQINKGQSQGNAPKLTLPGVIKRFKSLTTKRYIDGIKQNGWRPFNGRFWQRNYYEHIIRDEPELKRVRQYIYENPLKWLQDDY